MIKNNALVARNTSLDGALEEAQRVIPGARTDAAVTVFPRRDQLPAVVFMPLWIGPDRKPKPDGLEHVISLLAWACRSVGAQCEDKARRLALARQVVEIANDIYAEVLEEWEESHDRPT